MFTQADKTQIKSKGISLETIEIQLQNFRNGFPFAQLVRPATVGGGISRFIPEEIDKLTDLFDSESKKYSIVKFVPASGAASRMFKALFNYLEEAENSNDQLALLNKDDGLNSPKKFIENIEKFAFYNDLKATLEKQGLELTALMNNKQYDKIIAALVEEDGLDYGNLPKGLLKFHHYDDFNRVAMEEHLVEAAHYAKDHENVAHVHFTVSPEHMERFEHKVAEVKNRFEQNLNVTFNISFSIQKPSTDTLAVDMENKPFREEDGTLLFRPGGHGALIENLNDINADIVFVKNIDNIVPDRLRPETYKYKKVLGGLLMDLQQKVFNYLEILHGKEVSESLLKEIESFAKSSISIEFRNDYTSLTAEQKKQRLFQLLNRPIRICGMVKNEGEPGGGPFWVKNSKGQTSLQIVEGSQIDDSKSDQQAILQAATHFNPVDLACGVCDFKGKPFNLPEFVDPETGFISEKSKSGRQLKAQELPGLWNGAQANWITLFVEVPIITFNPVKTVNDLLREQHQNA